MHVNKVDFTFAVVFCVQISIYIKSLAYCNAATEGDQTVKEGGLFK